jgi:hypothetical protein
MLSVLAQMHVAVLLRRVNRIGCAITWATTIARLFGDLVLFSLTIPILVLTYAYTVLPPQ